jgi:hypothetical protein
MPTAAPSPRKMIWTTAKSTDVSSRHSAWPALASGFGATDRDATRSTAVVAIAGS